MTNSKIIKKSIEIADRRLTLEIGKVAGQANSAVLARYGDTMVLVTVVASKQPVDLDYFPLRVDYVEKLYAGGRIKGSRWVKREGRPSDEAILKARLIDRSIRPLFPKDYKREVQVTVTVLSVDGENDPDILAINGASAALSISDIPWNGPIGAIRIGYIDISKNKQAISKEQSHQFIINPTDGEQEYSDMDLVVAASRNKVIMLEGGMNQIEENKVLKAMDTAKTEIKKITDFIDELTQEIGKEKHKYEPEVIDSQLIIKLEKEYSDEIEHLILARANDEENEESLHLLTSSIADQLKDQDKKSIAKAIQFLFRKKMRHRIIKDNKRIDGRSPEQIRPISGEVGLLPRTHGSAIFSRGKTQALSIVTLAAPSLEQLIESPEGEETKRYMHHYYMPPYSVGETGLLGWPSRREIGHGALAERALLPVIPSEDKFPYTIRVVSEIMSSNGSTSMAATCGSTLSLMDAGVPISTPVAGVALGLVSEKEKYVILSDIQGIEDFIGDMDFKITGTKNGITAIQLDVKIDGLTNEIIKNSLEQAKKGRLYILKEMEKILAKVRPKLSKYAPKVKIIKIPIDKIGMVIGPGGKVIRNIINQTQATIDIDDDGTITISSPDEKMVDKAVSMIKGITEEVKVGDVYEGEVKRILPFGAFVSIAPGKEGLVHISKMAHRFVKHPKDVVKIGQQVKVKIIDVDPEGRINLSMITDDVTSPHPTKKTHHYYQRYEKKTSKSWYNRT